jgi:hypothetical protein
MGNHHAINGKITIFDGKITIFYGKITIFDGKITIFDGKITMLLMGKSINPLFRLGHGFNSFL